MPILPQGAVLLGEILEPVVVEVAAQSHRCQHQDGPVVHPLASAAAAGVVVDIAGHRPENLVAQLGLGVDVLEGGENGNDLVAAAEIQPHVGDCGAVHPLLTIERFSHGTCSSKIVTCLLEIPCLLTHQAGQRSHLRGAVFKKLPRKPPQNHLPDGH